MLYNQLLGTFDSQMFRFKSNIKNSQLLAANTIIYNRDFSQNHTISENQFNSNAWTSLRLPFNANTNIIKNNEMYLNEKIIISDK